MHSKLETIIIENNPEKTKYSIIWLHGLGADGNDFVPVVPQMPITHDKFRFIFPHAPIMPVTINGGMEMRAWFDLKSMSFRDDIDFIGINNSVELIQNLIQDEIKNCIKPSNIFLAGFSQGGTIALATAMKMSQKQKKCAGIIALSTFLPTELLSKISYPIFVGHGIYDQIITVSHANEICVALQQQKANFVYKTYQIQHSVCNEELIDIAKFINSKT